MCVYFFTPSLAKRPVLLLRFTYPLTLPVWTVIGILVLNDLVLDTMIHQGINTTSPVSDHRSCLHSGAEGLVLDTMVSQGINTTSPVSDHLGGLHPNAERPDAGHDGAPGHQHDLSCFRLSWRPSS